MPEISRFLGIVIRMYYRDHLPPHFHAEYGEHEVTVEIDSGIVEGRFPRRALSAVLDWYNLHRDELAHNWDLARQEQPLNRIEPLEQPMFMHVTDARHVEAYRVRLSFSDGTTAEVDLKDSLDGPIFVPLRDVEYFKSFSIVGHTLAWPNGADFAPEYLRSLVSTPAST